MMVRFSGDAAHSFWWVFNKVVLNKVVKNDWSKYICRFHGKGWEEMHSLTEKTGRKDCWEEWIINTKTFI